MDLHSLKRIQNLIDRESPSLSPDPSPRQSQVDGLVGGVMVQATDWRLLASMTGGNLAYCMGRGALMKTGSGWALRAVSAGLGLTAEVSTFEMMYRGLSTSPHPESPGLWKWNGLGGIRQGLLHSTLSFGVLKGVGHLARSENWIFQHLAQDTAMVAAHRMAAALNLGPRSHRDLAVQFLEAEAINLAMIGGMALAQGLSPRLHALGRGLDLLPRLSRPPEIPSLQRMELNTQAGGLTGARTPVFPHDPFSPLIFMKGDPSRRTGGESAGLSNRLLITRIREGDRVAAQELLDRARKEPRLFYRSSDLKWILGSLLIEKDPVLRRRLLETVRCIVNGAWGILTARHVDLLENLLNEAPLYRPVLDILIKISERRPDLTGEGLEERTDEMVFPVGAIRRRRSSLPEVFSRARFERIEIGAEVLRMEGTRLIFHDNSYSRLPVCLEGDLGEVLRQAREWVGLPPTQRRWLDRMEAALQKVRETSGKGQVLLNRLVRDYLNEAKIAHSVPPIDSKWFRLKTLSRHGAPEIQEALRKTDLSWLVFEEGSEIMRTDLLRLAEIGHPRAIAELVDLANGGSEWARRSLVILEIRDLAEADLKKDTIAQAEWVAWSHRVSGSIQEEKEALFEGILKMAGKALASQDPDLTNSPSSG